MMVDLIFVDSSNIEAIGYDDGTSDLHIQFTSGSYYIFHNVPRDIFESILYAPSKGSFFNREVKGIYTFTRQ
ncbi:MAG: KTSC domain-containing protein [Clostridium sp.]|nr:KTSC domain-containing protein [Clostridium sp.]